MSSLLIRTTTQEPEFSANSNWPPVPHISQGELTQPKVKKYTQGNDRTSPTRSYFSLFVIALSLAIGGCNNKKNETTPQAIVRGGSMAPAFKGKHFNIKCGDCEIQFSVDATLVPNHGHATCPNCGFLRNPYSDFKINPSTPITLELGKSNLNRWDVVAFQFPDSTKKGIKRIAGLPGESVKIIDGRVYVNGELALRDPKIWNATRILEFDSLFHPHLTSPNDLTRIVTEPSDDWTPNEGFQLICDGNTKFQQGYLFYRPISCFRGADNRLPTNVIQDNYGYNQSNRRIQRHAINRLALKMDVLWNPQSQLVIQMGEPKLPITFVFDHINQTTFIQMESKILATKEWVPQAGQHQIEVSNIGQIARIKIDDKVVLQAKMSDTKSSALKTSTFDSPFSAKIDSPVNIWAKQNTNGTFAVKRLKIYRDIYYTQKKNDQFQLGENEFLLLGDNSPVSLDGRTWDTPYVTREQIIGKITAAEN